MKKILGLASTLLAFGAVMPANAVVPSHTVTFAATVQNNCNIAGTPSIVAGTGFAAGFSQTASTFNVNVTGSTANMTSGELSLGTVTCSGTQMKITLTPNGWIKTGAGGSTREIAYSAYVKNGSSSIGSGAPLVSSAGGPNPGFVNFTGSTLDLRLEINTQTTNNLVAGTYAGTLVLSVDPI